MVQFMIDLVRSIADDPKCKLLSPSGLPTLINVDHTLPADLQLFYSLCGGAELYMEEFFGFRIVPPSDFMPAYPIIHRFFYKQPSFRAKYEADVSTAWYLFATGSGPEENIAIDTNPRRLGRCYDGYVSEFAGSNCKIVANSFTEILKGIITVRGTTLPWKSDYPPTYGYAYEDIPEGNPPF